MWRVKLYTSTGEYVVAVICLPFIKMPEIIIWGERFFQLCNGTYREAAAAVVFTEDQTNARYGSIDESKIVDWKP